MKVYDYTCESCGETHEHFVNGSDVATVACKSCGGTARRQVSAPRFKLPGDDPGFPGAWDKWGRDATKRHKEADKKARENGEL